MMFKIQKIFLVSVLLLVPVVSLAQWNDCTHGRIDDACAAPGECGSYVDTNNDKICDHSQPKPVAKTETVKNNKNSVDISDVSSNKMEDDVKDVKDKENLSATKDTSLKIDDDRENISVGGQIEDQKVLLGIKKEKHKQRYPFLQIVIGSTVLYLLTYLLAKKNIIRMITHKKIWNIFLTISFLLMALTSIILIIQINSGRRFFPSFDLMYWHVVTGSVMLIITIFHMGWHWRYYKNLFK